MMPKAVVLFVIILAAGGVWAQCTDSNCLACLPHDLGFCITCAQTHWNQEGVCSASCDAATGYREFVNPSGDLRCINTFEIACTSGAPSYCETCLEGLPTSCLSCVAGKFLEDSNCVDTCSGDLIAEQGLCKGNRRGDQNICAPGTYNSNTGSSSSTACVSCESGKFCGGYKGTSNDGNCDAGYYCTSGAKYAKNNDDIDGVGVNASGGRCTAGNSCGAGSSSQTACPPGKFCQRDGLASPSGNCQAGYYCKGGSDTRVPDGSSPAIGEPCPMGSYCEEGQAAKQCPTGTYMPYTGAASQGECIPCDPGKYCGTSGASAVQGDCDAGYFCEGGASSAQPEGGLCPKGYKCVVGSAAPEPCPITEYQDLEGQSSCKPCTAGNYCTEEAMLTCPAGYYCLANNNKLPCPPGKFRTNTGASDANDCTACTAGFACPSHAIITPTIQCKAGYYCTGGAITDMPTSAAEGGGLCQQGNYCPLGSDSQRSCLQGKFCPSQGLAAAAGDCQAGYYCTGGSTTAKPSGAGGDICRVGHYCPAGSFQEQICPEHTYIDYTGADDSGDCLPCPAGKTCTGGVISNTDCPAGSYCDHNGVAYACDAGHKCPAGSRDQIPCEPGYYQPNTSQDQCENCPQGKYCEDLGTVTPGDCPDGYYCELNTAAKNTFPCPIGYRGTGTSKVSQADGCQECDAGRYCASEGLTGTSLPLCDSGYFCVSGAKVPRPKDATDCISAANCGLCPTGQYCLQGSDSGDPCPAGTYRPFEGAKSTDDCMPVPPGKYFSGTGLTSLPSGTTGQYGDCTAGYICTGGSSSPTPSVATMGYSCAAGFFCEAGAVHQQRCAVGFYQDETQKGVCKQCPQGSYCPTEGLSSPVTCEAGYYCEPGSIIPTPCPIGKYSSSTGNIDANGCVACPKGKYCQSEGMATADNDCSAGYICWSGATNPTPEAEDFSSSNQVNGLCPRGHFCQPGTLNPEHCVAGTYNPSLGLGACLACPPGYHCPSVQMTAVGASDECDPGTVCLGGATAANPTDGITGKTCPVGFFCESGTAQELSCLDGQIQTVTGQSTCDPCPAGSLCQAGVQSDCVERKFCPQGSSYGQLCHNGRENELAPQTNLIQNDDCAACPAQKFCMAGLVTGDCQAGYLCTSLADSPTPNLGTGVAEPCPANFYCEIGENTPNACPSQKYTDGVGKMQESDCVDCANGRYCDDAVTGTCPAPRNCDDTFADCPAGAYCPNGSSFYTLCPVYTYNPDVGRFSPGHCLPCPAGYFCNQEGIGDLTTVRCTAGHYCVAKATFEIPCPAGTYRPDANLGDSYASCLSCPSGYYCPLATGVPQVCADNQYCLASSLAEPCPAGKHCTIIASAGNFPFEMSMVDCPANFYCEKGEAGPQACAADKFCPAGSEYEQICDIDPATGMCNSCPAGQWSTGMSECQACPAGYVCSGGTNTKYPIDPATENGYKCPIGNYCPEGSGAPVPCPIGTHNPNIQGASLDDCAVCSDGTYNFETGQSSCRSCGAAAYSAPDGASCRCYGAFRAFQREDASCTCKTGYSFETIDGSSSRDNCEPIPLPLNCNYNHLGVCGVDCQAECNSDLAIMTSAGICSCSPEPTGTPCDAACQGGFIGMQLDQNGDLTLTQGSDTMTTPVSSLPNTMGSPSCTGLACKVVSIVGGAVTSFEPANFFVNIFKSVFSSYTSSIRLLQQSTSFTSPVICVAPGTTVAFDTSAGNYPVYLKDSMLNTNELFDYSQFEVLGSRISQASATIQTFFFTFSEQGVYVFQDSAVPSSQTIVSVTSSGCPEAYIAELTEAALNQFGVESQNRGVEQIYYYPVGILTGFFAIVVGVVTVVLGYCVQIDKFDIELEAGGLDDGGKAGQDLRLLAIKRKLEEMIRVVQEEKGRKHSDQWQRDSEGKLQNFQDDVQLLVEALGLKEPEDGGSEDEEENSQSSRLSEIPSSGGPQAIEEIDSEGSSRQGVVAEEPQQEDVAAALTQRKLPEGHQDFLEEGGLGLEKRRAEFEAELRKAGLTGEERRAQVEEFEAAMAQLEHTLGTEQERQRAHLLRELNKRRKNKAKEEAKLAEVVARERALKERHAKEKAELSKTLGAKEQQIEKAYDQELRQQKREEVREKNEALKKFKADFHRKLQHTADPAEIRAMQASHNAAYKEFLRTMEEEQQRLHQHKYAKLAARKQKKLAELREHFEAQLAEHTQRQDQELMKEVLQEKMRLQAEHNLFHAEPLPAEDPETQRNQAMERELALRKLAQDQVADRNLVEIEFHQKGQQLDQQAADGRLELPAEVELKDRRAEFATRLAGAGSEREKKDLLKEQEAMERELGAQLQLEREQQGSALELRRLELREKKEAKLAQVQRAHDRERREKEMSLLEQEDAEREALALAAVDQRVTEAVAEGSKQELPLLVDGLLSQFSTQQLKNLLKRQFIETSRALGDVMATSASERVAQVRFLKERMAVRLKQLEDAGLSAKQFAEQTAKLQQQQEEELKNLEARSKLKQMDEEAQAREELARRHGEQKLALKEAQLKLKEDTMERLIQKHGGDAKEFLVQLKKDLLKNAADDLRDYSQRVESERAAMAAEMKKKLFFENQAELDEFEIRFRQEFQAEQDRVDKKLKAEKEATLKKRRASFEARLKRMEGVAQGNVELYVAEHEENMRRLDAALEEERQKQLAGVREKLKLRKMKLKKLKGSAGAPTFKPKAPKPLGFYERGTNEKAKIDYKVKLKEWAERVRDEPPNLLDASMSMDDISLLEESPQQPRGEEDELLERVLKIERMAKLILQ